MIAAHTSMYTYNVYIRVLDYLSIHPSIHAIILISIYSSTHTHNNIYTQAISAAVRLRPPVLVYPVHDLDSEYPVGYSTGKTIATTTLHTSSSSVSSSSSSLPMVIPRLLDCVQFKPGSTVGDAYEAMKRPGVLSHTVLSGEWNDHYYYCYIHT